MGYRLHYATKYRVEYDGGYFDYKTEINQLLAEKCDAYFNEDSAENSDRLEVDRDELVKMVQDIKTNRREYEAYIATNGWDYTTEDLVAIFEEMIAKSDQSNDFIVLFWY